MLSPLVDLTGSDDLFMTVDEMFNVLATAACLTQICNMPTTRERWSCDGRHMLEKCIFNTQQYNLKFESERLSMKRLGIPVHFNAYLPLNPI